MESRARLISCHSSDVALAIHLLESDQHLHLVTIKLVMLGMDQDVNVIQIADVLEFSKKVRFGHGSFFFPDKSVAPHANAATSRRPVHRLLHLDQRAPSSQA